MFEDEDRGPDRCWSHSTFFGSLVHIWKGLVNIFHKTTCLRRHVYSSYFHLHSFNSPQFLLICLKQHLTQWNIGQYMINLKGSLLNEWQILSFPSTAIQSLSWVETIVIKLEYNSICTSFQNRIVVYSVLSSQFTWIWNFTGFLAGLRIKNSLDFK